MNKTKQDWVDIVRDIVCLVINCIELRLQASLEELAWVGRIKIMQAGNE